MRALPHTVNPADRLPLLGEWIRETQRSRPAAGWRASGCMRKVDAQTMQRIDGSRRRPVWPAKRVDIGRCLRMVQRLVYGTTNKNGLDAEASNPLF